MSGRTAPDAATQTLLAPITRGPGLLAAWCPCETPSSPPPAGEILVRRVAALAVCRHRVHL